uniref:Uncharacterized protein n=1 Tax=Nicotiana tabacum TaxID=4097 RepID=A0A1S4D6Y1_TOBAC|nr:PREDICTED: uncharacterized protein LOC107826654 [Nicotiana tabacum]
MAVTRTQLDTLLDKKVLETLINDLEVSITNSQNVHDFTTISRRVTELVTETDEAIEDVHWKITKERMFPSPNNGNLHQDLKEKTIYAGEGTPWIKPKLNLIIQCCVTERF